MLKKADKDSAKVAKPARKATASRRKVKPVTSEMIQGRAYELFISGSHGSDVDHWLLAERELQSA